MVVFSNILGISLSFYKKPPPFKFLFFFFKFINSLKFFGEAFDHQLHFITMASILYGSGKKKVESDYGFDYGSLSLVS